MHDLKDHISRPCPDCCADGLRWAGKIVHCDNCGCEWSVEDLLDELATLEKAMAQNGIRKATAV